MTEPVPDVGPGGSSADQSKLGGYLRGAPPHSMLIHGVIVQIVSVLLSHWSSAVSGTFDPTAEPMQKMLSLGWGLNIVSGALSLIGWALAMYACARVIADALRGIDR